MTQSVSLLFLNLSFETLNFSFTDFTNNVDEFIDFVFSVLACSVSFILEPNCMHADAVNQSPIFSDRTFT